MRHNARMKETSTIETPEWFTADGSSYEGEVFHNDKGKPFGEVTTGCFKCGGTGRYKRKFECLKCGGEGQLFEQPRLFTAKEIEAKQRSKTRLAEAKAEADRQRAEERAVAYQDFLLRNQPMVERIIASGDKFALDVLSSAEEWGAPTDAQWEAVVNKLDKIDLERRTYGNSRPVGTVGERLDLEVTCTGRSSFMGKRFGGKRPPEIFVTEMVCPEGNAFVSLSESFSLNPGERAIVRGTVKEHDLERRAWPRTTLSRVAVLEMLAEHAPAPEEEAPTMGM